MENDSQDFPGPHSRKGARIFSTGVDSMDFTSINWWPKKLRPYESPLSLAIRFCAFNGISLSQYENYFGYRLGYEGQLNQDDLSRIASLLNEEISLVQTVFIPIDHHYHFGEYSLPVLKKPSDEIRYCQRCLEFGYHSYLHELGWLARCPLHLTPIKSIWAIRTNGNTHIRRSEALKHLMMSNCRAWPRSDAGDVEIVEPQTTTHLQLLFAWVKNTNDAAINLSRGQFWDCNQGESHDETSFKHAIGQLRKLENIPTLIEPLFTTLGESWQLEIQHFSIEVKKELHRLSKYATFSTILDFYKRVSARSKNPPSFIMQLRAGRAKLKERHGKCHCRWGREKTSWSYHWVKTSPDGWPYWQIKCPYEVALENLDLNWEHSDRVLSNREVQDELLHFVKSSCVMRDAGLIEYTPDANISPSGYLYAYPQVSPCCEWNQTSPLTQLLNKIAEFEIELAMVKLNRWLDAIDKGSEPHERDELARCLRLCETKEGLSLIKWIPQAAPSSDRRPRP